MRSAFGVDHGLVRKDWVDDSKQRTLQNAKALRARGKVRSLSLRRSKKAKVAG